MDLFLLQEMLPGSVHEQRLGHLGRVEALGGAEQHDQGGPVGAGADRADSTPAGQGHWD